MMTRREARMIAEELYKMVRGDIKEAGKELVKMENEEYITVKDVARILGWAPITVYRRKDDIGCYVRSKNRLRFVKSQLHRAIQEGRLG